MAEDGLRLHGKPLDAKSRSGEPQIAADIRARMSITFDLDLTRFGGPLIEDVIPPARILDRVVAVLTEGPGALARLPEHPQPNDAMRLLPPSTPERQAQDLRRQAQAAEEAVNKLGWMARGDSKAAVDAAIAELVELATDGYKIAADEIRALAGEGIEAAKEPAGRLAA